MRPGVLKIISATLTIVGGGVGILAGFVDQKLMTAEVAKQVGEAFAKMNK